MKKYSFISGLPRSGSTLLCNILAQNPSFHATATSGIMDIMFGVRNNWDTLVEFKACPNDGAKLRVLKGILDAYYADVKEPVVFDKCRGWLSLIEMAENVLGEKVKIIVPVRDMRDVLASFEKLWRKTSAIAQMQPESEFYYDFETVEGRVNIWLRADQPIGLAYNGLKDVFVRGFAHRLCLVDFNDLTSNPIDTMNKVYDFLGEERFTHNF